MFKSVVYETPAGHTTIPSLRPSPHRGGNASGVMPAANRQTSLSRNSPHRSADSFTAHELSRTERRRRFNQSGNHLLACLAITRQSRIQLGEKNSAVQGCFSDRERYIFMAIRNDGSIRMSNTYTADLHLQKPRDLKTIFIFVCMLFDNMSKSSAHRPPAVEKSKQEAEVQGCDAGTWMPERQRRLEGTSRRQLDGLTGLNGRRD